MKIFQIKLHPVATKRHTGLISHHVIIELTTDSGIGWGEVSDLGHLPMYVPDLTDLEKALNTLLVGQDARRIAALNAKMLQAFPEQMYVYDMGAVIRCGIDMALHDAVARQLGVPINQLLGGQTRDSFPVCYPIFRITSEEDVEKNLQTVKERQSEGFTHFRLYVGRRPEMDEAFCKQLPKGANLKSIDFSNILDWKEAWCVTERLLPYNPTLVESPTLRYDFEGLATFREKCPIPVSEHVISRHYAIQLLQNRSVDIFNIALTFIGGFEAALGMFRMAQSADIACLIGTTQELSLGTAAQAQIGAAVPNLEHVSDCTGPCLYADDVCDPRVRYDNSQLIVPEGPGLGLEPDRKLLLELHSPLASASSAPISATLDRTLSETKGDPSPRYGG